MKMAWLALAAATMTAPLDAAPLPTRVTGRALAALCNTDRNACIGYVVGSVDAFVATQIMHRGPVTFCLPAGVTNQQLAEAALAAIRSRPDLLDNNAATIVIVALVAAYPCAPPPKPARPPQPPGR
ncbi:MAG: Rap1a immunity protein [Sphingomonadales bacterium]|nr:Rap1a immunity protein [Sphingomonadales bacterium]MEA3035905.1 Rap1a immunity protein [Sphingomonadales bacterium]